MKKLKLKKFTDNDLFFFEESKISKTRMHRVAHASMEYEILKKTLKNKKINFSNKKIKNESYALKNLGVCVCPNKGQMPQYYIANVNIDGIVDVEISYRTSTIL